MKHKLLRNCYATATEGTELEGKLDLVLDQLILRTPTNATYNPTPGVLTITIGTHTLGVGGEIRIASCWYSNEQSTTQQTHLVQDYVLMQLLPPTVRVNVGRSVDTGTYTWSSQA